MQGENPLDMAADAQQRQRQALLIINNHGIRQGPPNRLNSFARKIPVFGEGASAAYLTSTSSLGGFKSFLTFTVQ